MEFQANRRWKNRGLIEVIMNEEGFFFFKFGCEDDLLEILEEDVCLIEGKPLILQRWYPHIVLSKDVPKTIPLWVKIYNIPLQYWNCNGLSRIGSGVGNILMADGLTEKMCRVASGRLSFAMLLIEVDANKPLPDKLFVHIPHDDFLEPMEVVLRVDYPWRPSWCPTCSLSGHNVHNCPVVRAAQEKKYQENKEDKKGFNDKDDFTRVQRKGKGKMGSQIDNQKQGIRAGGSAAGGYKHKQSSFHYVHRGGRA